MMTGILNNLQVDISSFLSKMPTAKMKSSEASLVAAGVVGIVTAVQLLTDRDPVGRCFTFWRQLRHHVSCCRYYYFFSWVALLSIFFP